MRADVARPEQGARRTRLRPGARRVLRPGARRVLRDTRTRFSATDLTLCSAGLALTPLGVALAVQLGTAQATG